MSRILFITTVYRTGEKVYPIIPILAKHANVDILNLYQMSENSEWKGSKDSRQSFYDECKKHCDRIVHGPAAQKSGDKMASVYDPFAKRIGKLFDSYYYDLVIIDNNIPTKGGATSDIYEWFHGQGIPFVGSPHGNRNFKGYKIVKYIDRYYDYSFVFGKKDRKHISETYKNICTKKKKCRLLLGGIPSNDKLKNYKLGNKYILLITNITDPKQIKGPVASIKPFNRKEVDSLNLNKLSEEFDCNVVVKLKNKMFHKTSEFEKSISGRDYIEIITDCEDDNQLIADAKFVITPPSTMAFKSIQIGIPTFILRGYGMMGNFFDFPDLIDCNYESLKNTMNNGHKDEYGNFIRNTLSGGIDFTSSEIYVEKLLGIMKKGM